MSETDDSGGSWPGLEDRAAVPELPPGARCRNHPDRAATAICTECRAAVCAECAPLKGGGHVFCQSCMAGSRLVDAEPTILGAPAEDAAAGPEPGPSVGRVAPRLRLAILIVIALGLAAAIAAVLLTSCNAPPGNTRQDDRAAPRPRTPRHLVATPAAA